MSIDGLGSRAYTNTLSLGDGVAGSEQLSGQDQVDGQRTTSTGIGADSTRTGEDVFKIFATRKKDTPPAPPPAGESSSSSGNTNTNLGLLGASLGTDIFAIMALAQKTAQEMRNANREIRATELNAQVTSLLTAADQMQKAADFRLAAGIVQGAFQIASGVTQMVASAASLGMSLKGSSVGADTDAGKAFNATGGAIGKSGEAASGVIGGVGKIISSGLSFAADSADIEAKRTEAQAKLHETASQHANDMMQQMMDVIRDVRDKLSSIQQAQIETNRGIARNI